MKKDFKYREIPYNYTSFSDKEVILKYFDQETWDKLNELREKRITGRSAKLLFEILGDIFIIDRNPYIYNDFIDTPKKLRHLKKLHSLKITAIENNTENELVQDIINKIKRLDSTFFENFKKEKKFRRKITNALWRVTSPQNIFFSAYHKVLHVTDATDWRVEYPEVVVYPESAGEISKLIKTASNHDLNIIPRGGGTGLTGGAIPVNKNTMIINTEKMRRINGIKTVSESGVEIPVIELESGVITDSAMDYCKERGYIFATDPTSSWASTIGGNISENAGGKKCVMWGTAIDNLYSFKIINARGETLEVKRRNHPHRKIKPEDEVIFDIFQLSKKHGSKQIDSVSLKGTDIRKQGVGKDITNKALGGVPGIQKEGGDGIIVSAKFVLYRPFRYVKTICLEFFGTNLINASKAIVEITEAFEKNEKSYLTALEHFDDKYEAAINYRNKSDRSELPKAVLLIDVESNNSDDLDEACNSILKMVKPYNTEGFIAKDEEAREIFWQDRKNLGAIAKHTNAFKLNEDVVIPIESLPLFSDFIEKLNIQKELENNISIIDNLRSFLLKKNEEDESEDEFLVSKKNSLLSKINETESVYTMFIEKLECRAKDLSLEPGNISTEDSTLFELIRDRQIQIDFKKDIIDSFGQTFHGYDELVANFTDIVDTWAGKKIIIATHMHAGDGNIHVNIPVHSNDYSMMQEADETAGIIMKKTTELGGVISGEHGIGLTKLKFIDQDILDRYAEYKKETDPNDLFNPGKLSSDFPVSRIYTPSLNLLEMEAFILEAADLMDLTSSISACVRCGKCKEVCNTHYPAENMFYSPRNKILGVSLITEAVLYDTQTSNSLSLRNFKLLREIASHCTMCHNCYKPCPVNIDFGEVTLAIKQLLVERKRSKFKAITSFVLFYLRRRGYYINYIMRILLLKIGYSSERIAFYLNKPFRKITERLFPTIGGILRGKLPKSGNKTLREELNLKGTNTFFAFMKADSELKKSVVYFPGCGSERMFPDISIAAIALLYNAGIRVVIAPEYLCCGYPLLSNGKVKQAKIKSYENRVVFHRMADTIGYMDIENVLISCGTCYEMLQDYQIENIFQNSSIIDISEFISREALYKKTDSTDGLLYHDPCHTPLKTKGYKKVFSKVLNSEPKAIPNCCGESGTLALSSPHIANSLRNRKRENTAIHLSKNEKATVLTTCPSCVQGLSKIDGKISITGKHMAVYLAEEFLGKNWKKDFLKHVKKNDGVERILL